MPHVHLPEHIALSRAGALAVVAAEAEQTAPPPDTLNIGLRIALLLLGSAVITAGIALLLWTQLGPGPLDVLITAVAFRWEIPITFVVWAMAALMIGMSMALGRKPGLGTLIMPVITGALLPVFMNLWDRWTPPAGINPAVIAWHVLAVAVIGLGAGAVIASGLGAGMGELLATAASERTGGAEALMRTGFEVTWLVTGVALGGAAGLGTVIVAVMIGSSVRLGYRAMAATVNPLRRSPNPEPLAEVATARPDRH
jgi:uncharacterized membrane protein YczE